MPVTHGFAFWSQAAYLSTAVERALRAAEYSAPSGWPAEKSQFQHVKQIRRSVPRELRALFRTRLRLPSLSN